MRAELERQGRVAEAGAVADEHQQRGWRDGLRDEHEPERDAQLALAERRLSRIRSQGFSEGWQRLQLLKRRQCHFQLSYYPGDTRGPSNPHFSNVIFLIIYFFNECVFRNVGRGWKGLDNCYVPGHAPRAESQHFEEDPCRGGGFFGSRRCCRLLGAPCCRFHPSLQGNRSAQRY